MQANALDEGHAPDESQHNERGLWMTLFYAMPAHDGALVYALRLLFGSSMLVSILFGVAALRRRDFVQHGNWMLRGYAIGSGKTGSLRGDERVEQCAKRLHVAQTSPGQGRASGVSLHSGVGRRVWKYRFKKPYLMRCCKKLSEPE